MAKEFMSVPDVKIMSRTHSGKAKFVDLDGYVRFIEHKQCNRHSMWSRYMMGIVEISLLAGSAFVGQPPATLAPPVDFFKEEITLAVDEGVATVHGVFYFRNNTDRERPFPVIFPFHTDSLTQFPHEIRAFTINEKDTVAINYEALMERGAIRMAVPMKANDVTIWHLDYTQEIESSRAKYILTSTSAWKKPLEEAVYRFEFPRSFDINYVWPETDSVIDGDRITLLSRRTDFMPQQDMEIIWERR
jgi:hypothetical protein